MKKLLSIALLAPLAGCSLPAQPTSTYPQTYPTPAATPTQTTVPKTLFTAEQLDLLLGPIALYPDALIAIMLPASTNASDIVLASRFLHAGGDASQIDAQSWDDSVKALARYPQVLKWMDENLAWTKQLGDAVALQSDEVMTSIQRLRARARAAGTLTNTPQQMIVYENNVIMIVPAQPDIIYVPYYDPMVVYAPARYYPSRSYFNFSAGFAAGWWLSYGLDWHDRCVVSIDRHHRERFWHEHRRDWHRPHHWTHTVRNHSGREEVHRWTPRPGNRWSGSTAVRPPLSPTPGGHDRPADRPEYRHGDRNSNPRGGPSRTHDSLPAVAPPNPAFVGPMAPPPDRTRVNRGRAPDPIPVPPLPSVANSSSRGDHDAHGNRRERGGNPGRINVPPATMGPTAPTGVNHSRTPSLPQASLGMPTRVERSESRPSFRPGPPSFQPPPVQPAVPIQHHAPALRTSAPPPPPAAPPPPPPPPPQQQNSEPQREERVEAPRRPPFLRAP